MSTLSPWLQRRLAGITGTDIAAILGKHPYKTAYEVWAEKVGKLPQKNLDDVEAVRWGTLLESVVYDEYIHRSGRTPMVIAEWPTCADGREALFLMHENTTKVMLSIKDRPLCLCTPDGMVKDWTPLSWKEDQIQHSGPGMDEIKTLNAFAHADWDGDAPVYHQYQSGYNAAVAGVTWFSVSGLIGGQELAVYDYGLKPDSAEFLLSTAEQFWQDHVATGIEPAVDYKAEDAWKAVHGKDDGSTVELDAEHFHSLDVHRTSLKEQAKEIATELKKIDMEIKVALRDASMGTAGDFAYTYKEQHRKGFSVAPNSFRVLRRKKL